jgi:uncharacterized protein (TIGR02996 family)
MDNATRPSDVKDGLATVLDDNLDVPVRRVIEFEMALMNSPADQDLKHIYRDWLLENDCPTRAGQLDRALTRGMPPDYTGEVRPTSDYNWAGL